MKLSKKSRYGLRALIDLAVNSKYEHVSLCSIAERNSISPQYLEQVFASLRRAGIVKGIKGSQGGYLLAREARSITVAEILEVLEGGYRLDDEDVPLDHEYRGIAEAVQTLVIDRVNEELDRLLKNVTLADLEKTYADSRAFGQDMYYI